MRSHLRAAHHYFPSAFFITINHHFFRIMRGRSLFPMAGLRLR